MNLTNAIKVSIGLPSRLRMTSTARSRNWMSSFLGRSWHMGTRHWLKHSLKVLSPRFRNEPRGKECSGRQILYSDSNCGAEGPLPGAVHWICKVNDLPLACQPWVQESGRLDSSPVGFNLCKYSCIERSIPLSTHLFKAGYIKRQLKY